MSWDPFKDMDDIMRVVSRFGGHGFMSSSTGRWAPAVDLLETETQFIVVADVPGAKKEDLEVSVDDNRVCLKGCRTAPVLESTTVGARFLTERGYGKFERCFQLPSRVAESSVKASYVDGQLEVHLDKEKGTKSSKNISIR